MFLALYLLKIFCGTHGKHISYLKHWVTLRWRASDLKWTNVPYPSIFDGTEHFLNLHYNLQKIWNKQEIYSFTVIIIDRRVDVLYNINLDAHWTNSILRMLFESPSVYTYFKILESISLYRCYNPGMWKCLLVLTLYFNSAYFWNQ